MIRAILLDNQGEREAATELGTPFKSNRPKSVQSRRRLDRSPHVLRGAKMCESPVPKQCLADHRAHIEEPLGIFDR